MRTALYNIGIVVLMLALSIGGYHIGSMKYQQITGAHVVGINSLELICYGSKDTMWDIKCISFAELDKLRKTQEQKAKFELTIGSK